MEQEDQPENKNGEKRKESEEATEESFLKELYFFMKQRDTPIERIPHLGFKQIDLYLMYKTVKDLGGYHQVTGQQLWKKVYNILGGNPRSTSAATCTRRHYEKLLLPYEYHQAGYGDELPITPPRKHKIPHFDDQYLTGPKRPLIRHVLYNQPSSHDFFTEGHLRTLPISISTPQFLHPVPSSMPNLFSVPRPRPPIPHLRTPFHTPTQVSYPPASGLEKLNYKHSLEFLRYLADEYKSLAEPLNLSNKKGSLETSHNTPSSFSPPSAKGPQFLNAPFPFYTKGDQPGAASGPLRLDPSAQAVVNPMTVDGSHTINLTSSSDTSSTLKKAPASTTTAHITHPPSYPSAVPNKQPEQSFQETKAKPSEKPQPSQAHSRPPLDSYGGMEIQIPLSLLQNWIKEGLISSLAPPRQQPSESLPNEHNKTPTPEPPSRGRMASESPESPISGSAFTRQHPSGFLATEPNKTPTPEPPSRGRMASESPEGHISGSAFTRQHPSGFLATEPNKTPTPEPPSRGRMASESPEGHISGSAFTRQHPSGFHATEPNKTPTPEPPSRGRMASESPEGPISGFASTCKQPPRVVPQESTKASSSPSSFTWGKIHSSSESTDSPSNNLPADLSMKSHLREAVNPKHDSDFTTGPVTNNESQLSTISSINRFASVKPFNMTASTKMPFSRDSYHRLSHIPYHKSIQAEEQEAWSKQSSSQTAKDSTGSKSPPGFSPDLATRLGKALEKAQMTKRNSTSSTLIQLTPEQLKLLLSTSALRLERGKIC